MKALALRIANASSANEPIWATATLAGEVSPMRCRKNAFTLTFWSPVTWAPD
jgi:hypothetical protein